MSESFTVKHRSVSITVYPWTHPSGRQYWRFKRNDGKHVTRASLDEAKREAKEHAMSVHRGTLDLETLSPEQLRVLRRIIDADPSLRIVDEFLLWHGRKAPRKPTGEAFAEFMALKESNAGKSTQNVRTLRKHVKPFADLHASVPLIDLTVGDVEFYLTSNPKNRNRTRRNIRASLVTFFRWCQVREYLPPEKTAAEKTEVPVVGGTIPETYTPQQLQTLMNAVRPEFLPWLVIASLAGVRTDEICPIAGSRKSPLDWSDFQWDRDILIVRPETAKMKRRRVVPIVPALRSMLWPIRKDSGPVHEAPPPTKSDGKGMVAETARLGALIGGWKPNALRHSFISYRCAQVGVGVTALEAGNSEAECKASYLDAKSAAEAEAWFSVMREQKGNKAAK